MVGRARRASAQTSQLSIGREYHDVTDCMATRRAELIALMQAAVRHAVQPYVQTREERQLVADVLRPDNRYTHDTMRRLLDIAARGDRPMALVDSLRDYVQRRVGPTVVLPCEALERAAVEAGDVNVALVRLHRDDSPEAKQTLVRELRESAAADALAADTLAGTK